MKGLSKLTQKIREWNFMGLSLLPSLQLAIIHCSKYTDEVIEILKAFECHDLLYNQNIELTDSKNQHSQKYSKVKSDLIVNEKQTSDKEQMSKQGQITQQNHEKIGHKIKTNLESFDIRLKASLYGIYMVHQPINCRIHLIVDKENQQKIDDQTLKKTKKIIQKLKRNKSIIFINFNTVTHKLDVNSQHIQQFGLSFRTKQRQIRGDQLIFYGHQKIKNVHKQKYLEKNDKSVKRGEIINEKKNQKLKKRSNEQKNMAQFNEMVKNKINSKFDLKNLNYAQNLMRNIEKKYNTLFAVEINKNFLEMKSFHKNILAQVKRYHELHQIFEILCKFQDEDQKASEGKVNKTSYHFRDHLMTKYALTNLHRIKQYLVSSLQGTFTNIEILKISSKSKNVLSSSQRSMHWQVMQIMNQIWDIEGDTLLKQIDKMPLTYIKDRYKMLDYQTIGGFMPGKCFEAIFSSPLRKMVEHIMQTLQIVEMKIVAQIKHVVQYFFHHTSCCYDFSDSLGGQISKISKIFRKQAEKVLKSQIEFISVSSDDFWSFKQVKSNLYAPQQQVYIQIKYIGKNYIKKVFDSIKETLPRLIGQNLLREIVNFLETNSLSLLTTIINQNPFEIELNNYELQKIRSKKQKQRRIDELIYFFSLKTSSQINVKNLNERLDKSWKRMFDKKSIKSNKDQDESQDLRNQGFLAWARQLFTKSKKQERPKRSLSQQKKQTFQKRDSQLENPQVNIAKKTMILSQKNWLLIVNTDKLVESQKIHLSGCEGFPSRLRPSIWLYLARKQYPPNILPKVQSLLDETQNYSQQESQQIKQVYKQIDKDVNRTPPPNLFKKGYLKDPLTRVLRAYSIYDKSLRYTQGMNFIVAIILCVLTHHGEQQGFQHENSRGSKMYFDVLENNCFTIFVNMMMKKGLRKIMLIERQTITDLCIKLTSYIDQNSSIMSEKIQQSGFSIQMIFTPALISSLTSADIEFPLQKRVIDLVIVSDFSHLHKVIGGFVVAAESLCEKLEGQLLYYFLKGKLYNQVYKVIGDDGVAKMFKGL